MPPPFLKIPEFPAPDIEGVMAAIKELLGDLQNEATGPITNISQAIVSIREMDCGGNWIVYVHTGVVAAGRALYMLLIPSLDEILENYLQPKPGRRGQRRGGRGERIRKAVGANAYRLIFSPPIPDVDDALANILPGRGLMAGRQMLPGEWIFWTGVDLADALLWQWLLIEATETFTVTWMSELMQSGKCKYDADARAQFQTGRQGPFLQNHLWFNAADLINVTKKNLTLLNNGTIELAPDNLQGHALLIIIAEWLLERQTKTGDASFAVGVHATVHNKWGDLVAEKTDTVTITCSPGKSTAALLDFSIITEDFNQVHIEFVTETIINGAYDNFECWAKVALDVRGVNAG